MPSKSPEFSLSDEEVDRYRTDGFVTVSEVISCEELQLLRAACDSENVRQRLVPIDSENTVHLPEITFLHPSFMTLAKHPAIVGRIQSLLGPHIQLHHSKLAS